MAVCEVCVRWQCVSWGGVWVTALYVGMQNSICNSRLHVSQTPFLGGNTVSFNLSYLKISRGGAAVLIHVFSQ